MSAVSERDYLLLLAGIRQLSESRAHPPALRPVVFKIIQGLIPCEHLTYNELPDDASKRGVYLFNDPTIERATAQYVPAFQAHLHEHPIARRQQRTPRTSAVTKISDFLPDTRFRRLGLYHDCYRHLDTDHQLVVPILTHTRARIGIAINRKGRDFDERERRLLTLLSPHLSHAFQRAAQREAARQLTGGPGVHPTDLAAEESLRDRLMCEIPTAAGERLTSREADVLLWVMRGKSNPQIGVILGISPRTVQKHLEHVFQKLGVETRAACVVHVLDAWR